MQATWLWRGVGLAGIAILGACGGGGGGGNTAALASLAGLTGAPGASTVTLSGTASYDSVPNLNGPLAYSSTASKPVRGATVEIVNAAAAVVATTSTDANGAYSVALPSSTSVFVRVKAQMTQGGNGPGWDVTVRDNTQSDAIYAMETPAFSTGVAATTTRDVHATSGWDGSHYASARVAAPFAVLDTIYATQAKVLSVAPATVFPTLRVFWSSNNVPASGNPALGQIGTTSFTDGSEGRSIYVLGKEDVDTDEYDSSVVAHEWGHYYQSAFSRDDSPGGNHAMSDRLDRRVAFSEGWGNAWSGIALARSNYTDSAGPAQGQGANIDLTVDATTNPGWYQEASIHSLLWRLNSQVGFKPIHDTLTGPFKNGLPVTSIHPFAAAFSVAAPASTSALVSLLTSKNISGAVNDPFGTLETNNGGVALALPMYRQATVGAANTACVTNQAGNANKLGSYAYLRFTVPATANYTITLTGPAAADPDFAVFHGGQIAKGQNYGATESDVVSLPAGESVLVVNDFNNSSASTCFNVTIQ